MQGRRDLDQERARALSLEMEQQRTLDRATHARTPDGASRLLAHTAASVQKTASVTLMTGGMMTSVSVSDSSPAPTTQHVPVVPLPVDGTSRLLAQTTASAQKTALKSGGGGGGVGVGSSGQKVPGKGAWMGTGMGMGGGNVSSTASSTPLPSKSNTPLFASSTYPSNTPPTAIETTTTDAISPTTNTANAVADDDASPLPPSASSSPSHDMSLSSLLGRLLTPTASYLGKIREPSSSSTTATITITATATTTTISSTTHTPSPCPRTPTTSTNQNTPSNTTTSNATATTATSKVDVNGCLVESHQVVDMTALRRLRKGTGGLSHSTMQVNVHVTAATAAGGAPTVSSPLPHPWHPHVVAPPPSQSALVSGLAPVSGLSLIAVASEPPSSVPVLPLAVDVTPPAPASSSLPAPPAGGLSPSSLPPPETLLHVPIGVMLPHMKETPFPPSPPPSFANASHENHSNKKSNKSITCTHDDKENSPNQERKRDHLKVPGPDFDTVCGSLSDHTPGTTRSTTPSPVTTSAPTVTKEEASSFVLPTARSKSIIADLGY